MNEIQGGSTMSNIDVYNQVDAVLKRLYGFTEKRQIDALFDEENINDYNERIKLLHKCMEVEDIYNTPEEISAKEDYDFTCAVFEEGTWRMLN